MAFSIIFLVIFIVGFYLLYVNGYLTINAKKAVSFLGSIRGNCRCQARFKSCDGYMKRVVKFNENRLYNFFLDCDMNKGYMTVELWDTNKHKLMCLKDNMQNAGVNVQKKKKYYLVFKFKSATGSFDFSWH